ncbi:hypothetical protein [Vibrio sp. C8]
MPSFIVITSKKHSTFDEEAKTVLESHKFSEVNSGTYQGSNGAHSVALKLKNLDSYKKNHSTASIKIFHGTLSS